MEWTEALNESIDFMEQHLLEDISAAEVATCVHMSTFYYQKAFKMLTGFTVGEYIRNRRLSLAAQELISGENKVIDVAYKYGYETPESFTKAFSRFHGITPAQAKKERFRLQFFQPLIIKIKVEGGNKMEYRVEKKEEFQVVGYERKYSYENAFAKIPKFWAEICMSGESKGVCGMFGISIDEEMGGKEFRYLIADSYHGQEIPDGCKVFTIPEFTFAVFPCVGPMPGALQGLSTKIFSEWFPGNKEYEIAAGYNVEMYTEGDISAVDYKSEMWIPVKRKSF